MATWEVIDRYNATKVVTAKTIELDNTQREIQLKDDAGSLVALFYDVSSCIKTA